MRTSLPFSPCPPSPDGPPRISQHSKEEVFGGRGSVPPGSKPLPNPDAAPATHSGPSTPRSPLWGSSRGYPRARLGQRKLGSGWCRMPIVARLGVPIGSQDGVGVGALPPGAAPVAPQDSTRLLLLELLPVFPRDLHRVVLGHGGLGVLRPPEESHLQEQPAEAVRSPRG